jgi:hypothetical protein
MAGDAVNMFGGKKKKRKGPLSKEDATRKIQGWVRRTFEKRRAKE